MAGTCLEFFLKENTRRTQPTLLQIFSEFMFNAEVDFESVASPDAACQGDLHECMGVGWILIGDFDWMIKEVR